MSHQLGIDPKILLSHIRMMLSSYRCNAHDLTVHSLHKPKIKIMWHVFPVALAHDLSTETDLVIFASLQAYIQGRGWKFSKSQKSLEFLQVPEHNYRSQLGIFKVPGRPRVGNFPSSKDISPNMTSPGEQGMYSRVSNRGWGFREFPRI